MAPKRRMSGSPSNARPLKQSKLNFASKSVTTPHTPKAGPAPMADEQLDAQQVSSADEASPKPAMSESHQAQAEKPAAEDADAPHDSEAAREPSTESAKEQIPSNDTHEDEPPKPVLHDDKVLVTESQQPASESHQAQAEKPAAEDADAPHDSEAAREPSADSAKEQIPSNDTHEDEPPKPVLQNDKVLATESQQPASGSAPKDAQGDDDSNRNEESQKPAPPKLRIIAKVGDIFDAPEDAVLIHACNCIGNWGAGIAAAFKKRYPAAHRSYVAHFKRAKMPESLVSTAELIPPSEKKGPRHWVGCLFTSVRVGKRKDSPEKILRATGPAMRDLMRQIKKQVESGKTIGEVRMCEINSGLFKVPWPKSKDVIESIAADGNDKVPREIVAYSLD